MEQYAIKGGNRHERTFVRYGEHWCDRKAHRSP